MTNMISDGTGKGYRARVNNKNRLSTTAESLDNMYVRSLNGVAYTISTPVFSVDATITGPLFYYVINETTRYFALQHIQFFWSGGDVSKNITAKFVQKIVIVEPSVYTTSNLVQNMNFGSSETAQIDSTRWNGTDGYGMTGGFVVDSANFIVAPGMTELKYNGSFILAPGTKIGYGIDAPEAGECAISVVGFLVDPNEEV